MTKCKDCGRSLKKVEKKYCPACKSKRSGAIKNGLAGFGALVIAILAAFGGGNKNNS